MSKTVLIVDDSPSVRQMVGLVLKTNGYEVLEAENGLKALEFLDGRPISLIVSDVNMPEMDGLTFVGKSKERDDYRFTPVLMLTTESDADMKSRAKAMGVKAWMVKPFQPQIFLSAIKKLT